MQNLEENLPKRLTDKRYGIPFNHLALQCQWLSFVDDAFTAV